MLRQNEQIIAVKNCFGTEYIIQTERRKNIQSVQVIVSRGRRRTNLEKSLAEEYVIYVKHTMYKTYKRETRYIRLDLPNRYLNTISSEKSPMSRWIIANTFRLMYSFLYLKGYRIDELTYAQALTLVAFLKNSSMYVISNEDQSRENNTVALYLSQIRSYIKWLGVDSNHPLLLTNQVMHNDKYGDRQVVEKNVVSVKHYSEDTIRYYITRDEYMRIREAKCLGSKYDRMLVRCIVDLMFLHGLRIGEILSLTLEDLYTDTDRMPCIVIRNRFTKDKFRLAKGCMNVVYKSNYTNKGYQNEDEGYQVVYLVSDSAKSLADYISLTHDFLPPRKKTDMKTFRRRQKTYKETSVADTVAEYVKNDFNRKKMKLPNLSKRSIDGKNHYLFLNRCFMPLSDANWNKILRKVMIDEHIGVDFGRKKYGLNHRFRHGFAIDLLRENNLEDFKVMKLMRHNSTESISPYLKLTAEEVLELRTEHTKETYELLKENVESMK